MFVALKTLGCRLNEAEIEKWSQDFLRFGYNLTRDVEQADVVVINTCAVTQEAVKKSRQLIRKSQRNNPRAKLVVSGCYGTLEPSVQQEISGIDLLVENQDKDKLADLTRDKLFPESMPRIATEAGETALFQRGRNRAFIKVQDGCRYRCTFCIVTVARGVERSKSIESVIDEINLVHSQGVQEVVLSGVHIGGYGSDSGTDLSALIQSVLENTDIPRIRLGSVEPWDLGESFFTLFDNPRFMPHLHLPLQSGNDFVLRRMGRRCLSRDYFNLIEHARKYVPDFNVTTDVIVGFPGESQHYWEQSLRFIEDCEFSHVHIFPYSKRQGTKAATFDGQIPSATRKLRVQELHKLAEKMRRANIEKLLHHRYQVLIENRVQTEPGTQAFYQGYTNNYHKVKIRLDNKMDHGNQIYKVKITDIDANDGLPEAVLI